jgi:hypothetical protein
MGQNPKVFKRSHIDIASTNVNLTVTDSVASNTGQSFVDKIRNRNNFSGWGTTGSNDAAGTTLEADFIDQKSIDTIILTGHNFETYTIEKWNGSSYVAFSEAISESSYASNFSAHEFQALRRLRESESQSAGLRPRMTTNFLPSFWCSKSLRVVNL